MREQIGASVGGTVGSAEGLRHRWPILHRNPHRQCGAPDSSFQSFPGGNLARAGFASALKTAATKWESVR
jgi:hypothetical protein